MELTSRITAALLAILLLPLLLLVALISLFIQGLPIIFIQPRVGKNFKNFNIYKFRTIKNNGSNTILAHNGELLQITRWGKFLRKTKIDELPQLLNVIKGDMRFIGPRPEIPEFVSKDTFAFLNDIKPGLSGYSSIIFRNESEILSMIDSEDPYNNILNIKLALDNYYVTKKGFFQDLKLVGITILSLFTPKRMGHYLFIKLLKIENSDNFNFSEIIEKARIKISKHKEINKNDSRNIRIMIFSDIITILSSFIIATFVYNNFAIPDLYYNPDLNFIICAFLAVKMSSYYFFRLYKGMWRYTAISDIAHVFNANFVSTGILLILFINIKGLENLTYSILFIDFILSIGITCFTRIGVRLIYSHLLNPKSYNINLRKRVILIGAGKTGEFICRELLNNSKHLMDPIGFLDDEKDLKGKYIHRRKVLGKVSDLNDFLNDFDEILICCPNAPRKKIFQLIEKCKSIGKSYRILPSPDEMLSGKLSLNELKEVSILDLLGNNEIELDQDLISNYIHGKRILITGAGGSTGAELVRQCLRYEPALLVILDNNEYSLLKIEREILSEGNNVLVKPLLTNVRDLDILGKVFNEYEPQIVFHAASYKHVSMQESFPWEAIETNVNGTKNLVKLSQQHRVEKFILISTDKALNPINIMGATKRLAEVICQGANQSFKTRFMVVRFGNLIDSNRSIIPIFKEQIRSGGPVTITDPNMERYFMSSSEAAQLILQSGSIGKGGEIFTLDMGAPIKIIDIANELIKLSGFEPEIDIPISFIGARAGEDIINKNKSNEYSYSKTTHDRILQIHPEISENKVSEISNRIMNGELVGHEFDNGILRSILSSLVPEYQPLNKDQVEPLVLKISPKAQA